MADEMMKMIKVDQLRYEESFIVDAVLWDMDGTLVDSIGAVEDAWGSVAAELGRDRDEVIELTHGRRAIDNLRDLKPELRSKSDADMEEHVEAFETKILDAADKFQKEVRSRRASAASSIRSSRSGSTPNSRPASRANSMKSGATKRKGSFAAEVASRMAALNMTSGNSGINGFNSKSSDKIASPASRSPHGSHSNSNGAVGTFAFTPAHKQVESPPSLVEDDPFEDDDEEDIDIDQIWVDTSDLTDNSVQIMPSVRRLINCTPDGRWAISTSGAATYCHGALSRVGITRPPVTITADDKRLKRGKPFPDPFLLAAEQLGFDCSKCLVVEDSPSGIRAAVASGAKTIAVATSHPAEKIRDSGAHYLVPTLDCVTFEILPDLRIRVRILPDIAAMTKPRVPMPEAVKEAATTVTPATL